MKNFVHVVALALSAVLAAPAHAAEALQQRMIVVSGEGEVLAKPDQARITAAVVTQAPTAEQAAQGNAAAMNRVLNALSMLGIPPAIVQTSNYYVQPQYTAVTQRTISGYQATNQVTIVVDDLARLGTISDTLVRAGAILDRRRLHPFDQQPIPAVREVDPECHRQRQRAPGARVDLEQDPFAGPEACAARHIWAAVFCALTVQLIIFLLSVIHLGKCTPGSC